MANIREAILKAAEHIENFPREFNFMEANSPSAPHCGTPGCALGWIGTFSKLDWFTGYGDSNDKCELHRTMNIKEQQFYDRMDEVFGDDDWMNHANKCAQAMRLYADKYHPASPSFPSGSEIVRGFIRKPMRELV